MGAFAPADSPVAPVDPQVIPAAEPSAPNTRVAISCNTTRCYAAWTSFLQSTGALAGTRLGLDGMPLDGTATALSRVPTEANQGQSLARVATNGSDFLILWDDTDFSSTSRYARVRGADGVHLDPPPGRSWNTLGAALASNGIDYGAAWATAGTPIGTTKIHFGRLAAASGDVLDPDGILLATTTGNAGATAIVFDGSRYVVAWPEASGTGTVLHVARVDADGTLADGPGSQPGIPLMTSTSTSTGASLAVSGGTLLAVLSDATTATYQRFSITTLAPLDSMPKTSNVGGYVQAIATGSTFGLLATGAQGAFTRVRATDGVELSPSPLSSDTDYFFALAGAGSEFLLAARQSGIVSSLRIRASDGSLVDTTGTAIVRQANWQRAPIVGSDGTSFWTAWRDYRSTVVGSIYGMRVSSTTGAPLDPVATTIPATTGLTPRSVSPGGDFYFLVSASGAPSIEQIFLDRVRIADGQPLPGQQIIANGTASTSAVACDSVNCLVAYRDYLGRTAASIYAIADGSRTSFFVVNATSQTLPWWGLPSVSTDGTNFLIVADASGSGWIRGKRVRSSDGALLDGAPESEGIPISNQNGASAAVAFDGKNYLVAWNSQGLVQAARLSTDGTLLDGPPTTGGFRVLDAAYPPKVVFDGTAFVVSNGAFAARVSSDGHVLDATPFVLPATTSTFIGFADVAASPKSRRVLASYDAWVNAPPIYAYRSFVHMYAEDVGASCGGVATCSTGFCVDGVCCENACGNGVSEDCQACSIAAGGTRDGACTIVPTGRSCRAPISCRLGATCDGVSTTCPASAPAPEGTPCAGGACAGGVCIPSEGGAADASPDGSTSDSGADGSTSDAGADSSPDAEAPRDAGPIDGSFGQDGEVDAAAPSGPGGGESGGCACTASRRSSAGDFGAFVLPLLFIRRRKKGERVGA